MKIYKTMLTMGNEGRMFLMDTIMHDGAMWLVPRWLESPETGGQKPERLILLDVLPHQKADGVLWGGQYNFVLTHPLPTDLLDGRIPPESEDMYVVLEAPDLGPTPAETQH